MSVSYPDLPLTIFPDEGTDTFVTYLNISITDAPLVKSYFEAIRAGNQTLALSIFNQIPNGSQKILTAQGLNKFGQALTALERFYRDDVSDAILTAQAEWQAILNEFSYQGYYSAAIQYTVNNYVTYTTAGVTNLYIVTAVPPVGTAPSNTSYWRVLTVRGLQGVSGVGMSFMGEWDSALTYSVQDCVTYDNALWGCIVANTNQTPFEGSTYWNLIYKGGVETYPVSETQPAVQNDGDLWFQIMNSDLEPMSV